MNLLKDELFNELTKDHKAWKFDRYRARHKSGISYWIGNGIFFFNVEDGETPTLGFINWIMLFFWLKWAKNKQIIEKLQQVNP